MWLSDAGARALQGIKHEGIYYEEFMNMGWYSRSPRVCVTPYIAEGSVAGDTQVYTSADLYRPERVNVWNITVC